MNFHIVNVVKFTLSADWFGIKILTGTICELFINEIL